MTNKPLLKSPAMAERLGITERHLRNLVARREIPFKKVGRLNMFDQDEVQAWLDDNTVEAVR